MNIISFNPPIEPGLLRSFVGVDLSTCLEPYSNSFFLTQVNKNNKSEAIIMADLDVSDTIASILRTRLSSLIGSKIGVKISPRVQNTIQINRTPAK